MRDRSRFSIRAIASLAAGCLLGAAASAQELETVRAYLEQGLSENDLPIAWVMDVEVTRESSFDRAIVNRRASEFQSRPDHPDAPLWAYHYSLHAEPEQESLKFGFRGGTDWFWQKAGKDVSYRAAGTGDVRWQLSERPDGGQLTATRSGVPFPSGYNIGLMRDQAARLRDLILMVLPGDVDEVESVERAGSGWRAKVKGSGLNYQIEGTWHAGEPVLSSITTLAGDPLTPIGERIGFSGYRQADNLGLRVAGMVTIARPDGVVERMKLVSISPIEPDAMSGMLTVPQVDDDVVVYDFRKPFSDAHAAYQASTQITWNHKEGRDTYDVSELELGAISGTVVEARGSRFTSGKALAVVIAAASVIAIFVVFRVRQT